MARTRPPKAPVLREKKGAKAGGGAPRGARGIKEFPKVLRQYLRATSRLSGGKPGIYIAANGFDALLAGIDRYQRNYINDELPSGAMAAAINGLGAALERNFRTKGASGGHPWPAISPGTRAIRMKLGYPPDDDLVRTGALSTAVSLFVTKYDPGRGGMAHKFHGTHLPDPAMQSAYKASSKSTKKKVDSITRQRKQKSNPVHVIIKSTPNMQRGGTAVSRSATLTIRGKQVWLHKGYDFSYSDSKGQSKTRNVPARPFWYVSKDGMDEMSHHVRKYIADGHPMAFRPIMDLAKKKRVWNQIAESQIASAKLQRSLTRDERVKAIERYFTEEVHHRSGGKIKDIGSEKEIFRSKRWMTAQRFEKVQQPEDILTVRGVLTRVRDITPILTHSFFTSTEHYVITPSGTIRSKYHTKRRVVAKASPAGFSKIQETQQYDEEVELPLPGVRRVRQGPGGARQDASGRPLTYFKYIKDVESYLRDFSAGDIAGREADKPGKYKSELVPLHQTLSEFFSSKPKYGYKLTDSKGLPKRSSIERAIADIRSMSAQELEEIGARRRVALASKVRETRRLATISESGETLSQRSYSNFERKAIGSGVRFAIDERLVDRESYHGDRSVEKRKKILGRDRDDGDPDAPISSISEALEVALGLRSSREEQEQRELIAKIYGHVKGGYGDAMLDLRNRLAREEEEITRGLGKRSLEDYLQFREIQDEKQRLLAIEDSYFAPDQTVIVSPKTGKYTIKDRGQFSSNLTRTNIAVRVYEAIVPRYGDKAMEGAARKLIQEMFGHTDFEWGRDYTRLAYSTPQPVPERKIGMGRGREKPIRTYSERTWNQMEMARNRILWMRRTLAAMEYFAQRAWEQMYYYNVELRVKHELGMYSQSLDFTDDSDPTMRSTLAEIRSRIEAEEKSRDLNWTLAAGLDPTKVMLYGPRYFSKRRELGWLVNYDEFTSIFLKDFYAAGSPLNIRSIFGADERGLSTRMTSPESYKAVGQSGAGNIYGINRTHVSWLQAVNGLPVWGISTEAARRAGVLTEADAPPHIVAAARVKNYAYSMFTSQTTNIQASDAWLTIDEASIWREETRREQKSGKIRNQGDIRGIRGTGKHSPSWWRKYTSKAYDAGLHQRSYGDGLDELPSQYILHDPYSKPESASARSRHRDAANKMFYEAWLAIEENHPYLFRNPNGEIDVDLGNLSNRAGFKRAAGYIASHAEQIAMQGGYENYVANIQEDVANKTRAKSTPTAYRLTYHYAVKMMEKKNKKATLDADKNRRKVR